MQLVLTTELLLQAYKQGLFPMAYSHGSPYIHWICPDMRGQLSIEDIHVSRSLKKTIRQKPFDIRVNEAFSDVVLACAKTEKNRPETWINEPIIEAYNILHKDGHAHSVECWQDDKLVGGLYGVSIGGAFFGESMFSQKTNASKVALIHLCARLWKRGYSVLDTQFVNDHLKQFGVFQISHKEYLLKLEPALQIETDFLGSHLCEDEIISEYFQMRERRK